MANAFHDASQDRTICETLMRRTTRPPGTPRARAARALAVFLFLTIGIVFSPRVLAAEARDAAPEFRPPAVPLVCYNPFLSIWSEADKLTDDVTRHWTHREHPLVSLIRVDGESFRLMGVSPKAVPALPQVGLQVLPTRSIYDFENGRIHVTLTFMTPSLPTDLDVLARPVTYLTWQVRSMDGKSHAVSLYDSTSSLLAVNNPDETVLLQSKTSGALTLLRAGTQEQPILQSMGDDHRINWGYAYVAAPTAQVKATVGGETQLEQQFIGGNNNPSGPSDSRAVMAFTFDLGSVTPAPVTRQVMVAYDEIYAIKYYGKRLRPYWRRNGATPETLFAQAAREYPKLLARCEAFDSQLMADAAKVGGEKYARIVALSYRQFLCACGLAADANKQPLFFTKENTSNGDIATVDVIFPMAPGLILLSPTLAKASIASVLMYSASSHWKFPNAPHDLGTYPVVMGRDDGGEGMPVEESGNMLIICDAIAQADGNAKFVAPWWKQLTQWAKYLEQYGLDPEDQLCTDDFMGHLAHNANLSVKAILGLAAYGDLCKMRGDLETAEKYKNLALADAKHWVSVASEGDHSRLAFDQPKTWSQKYNLVWDRILGLNIFPPEVARDEIAYYKKMLQPYGVPLDSRTHLSKTDWSIWSATMAEKQEDFEAIVDPIYDYLNQTSARSPLADSYITDDIKSDGMHARPVVGGLFIKILADPLIWKKWAGRDKETVGNWARLPEPPKVVEVVPTSRTTPQTWRYSIEKPSGDWMKKSFDASSWKEGPGGFGTEGTPGAVVHTTWNTGDIWLRREMTIPATGSLANLQFFVYHDEDIEIYVDGVLAGTEGGFISAYQPLEIRPAAKALLKPGAKVMVAVHCHQTEGGQGVDVGFANVTAK